MSRPRVLMVYKLPDAQVERQLAEKVELVRPAGDDAASIGSAIVDADAVCLHGPAKLTAAHIASAPRLKIIAALGSGTDCIDVGAATSRRIPVVHGSGVAARAVAEYSLAAMVAVHRGFLGFHNLLQTRALDWVKEREGPLVRTELTGTTLGIIGFGAIGQTLARMARGAYDMKVLAYDPYRPAADGRELAERVNDLNAMLEASLTVAVHVPLSPTSRGLLKREQLRLIGPDGVLVNASRGGVVVEADLIAALKAGELKGAAVDVFETEPPLMDDVKRLAAAPNIMLTPHVAGVTDQAYASLSRNVTGGILAVLSGRRPTHVVNPQVFTD